MDSKGELMLTALITGQRELEARLRVAEATPEQTLAIGRTLLAFAAREHEIFSTLAPLLDAAAQEELTAEHRAFAEDLELLEWLVATTPASPDIPVFSSALLRRMRDHIERDGRLLARAATLQH